MLPTTAWIVTNYGCNNRCFYCYAADACNTSRINNDEILDYDYALDVIRELKWNDIQNILLIGGEPTLYPQLIPLIEYGHKLKIQMKLVSNGRKLSDINFVIRLRNAGLVHSSVSIEAAEKDKHNSITQSSSFEESLQGLVNLIQTGISCNSIMTISNLNIDEIIPTARLVHKIKVPNILYNFSLPSIQDNGEISDSFSVDPKEYAKVIEKAYYQLKKEGIKIAFFATLPLCFFSEDTLNDMKEDQTIGRDYYCHIYYGTGIVFEPNGNVLPCTHFVNSPLFNAKNKKGKFIYSGTLAEELEEGIHKKFINEAWYYPDRACNGYKHWGKCFGGCPFIWMKYKPNGQLERR